MTAVLSGVVIRFWFEILNDKYLKPVRDYGQLRRKVASALLMFAPEISDKAQVSIDQSFPVSERHLIAGQTFRSLAAELEGIIYSFPEVDKGGKWFVVLIGKLRAWAVSHLRSKVPSDSQLRDAVSSLVGMSNSFFLPAGVKHDDGIGYEMNERRVSEIRQLIGLAPDPDIERELKRNGISNAQ